MREKSQEKLEQEAKEKRDKQEKREREKGHSYTIPYHIISCLTELNDDR
jgi:hypothetical protein